MPSAHQPSESQGHVVQIAGRSSPCTERAMRSSTRPQGTTSPAVSHRRRSTSSSCARMWASCVSPPRWQPPVLRFGHAAQSRSGLASTRTGVSGSAASAVWTAPISATNASE